MALTTESPRCLQGMVSLSTVQSAIDEIGHIVADYVWNPEYLVTSMRVRS